MSTGEEESSERARLEEQAVELVQLAKRNFVLKLEEVLDQHKPSDEVKQEAEQLDQVVENTVSDIYNTCIKTGTEVAGNKGGEVAGEDDPDEKVAKEFAQRMKLLLGMSDRESDDPESESGSKQVEAVKSTASHGWKEVKEEVARVVKYTENGKQLWSRLQTVLVELVQSPKSASLLRETRTRLKQRLVNDDGDNGDDVGDGDEGKGKGGDTDGGKSSPNMLYIKKLVKTKYLEIREAISEYLKETEATTDTNLRLATAKLIISIERILVPPPETASVTGLREQIETRIRRFGEPFPEQDLDLRGSEHDESQRKETAGKVKAHLQEWKENGKLDDFVKLVLAFVTPQSSSNFLAWFNESFDPSSTIDWVEHTVFNNEQDGPHGQQSGESKIGAQEGALTGKLKERIIDAALYAIPNVPIPSLNGSNEGIEYSVSGLNLSGFKLNRNSIHVKLGSKASILKGDTALKLIIDNVQAKIEKVEWSFAQQYFPFLQRSGVADADVMGLTIVVGFHVYRQSPSQTKTKKKTNTAAETEAETEKAGEQSHGLGIGISALRVGIEGIDLHIHGKSTFAWLYNIMKNVFSHTIKKYIQSLIQEKILDNVSEGVKAVNAGLKSLWSFPRTRYVFRNDIAQLAAEEVAFQRSLRHQAVEGGIIARSDCYSAKFSQEGTLGIAFTQSGEYVVVQGFRRSPTGQLLPGELSGKVKKGDIIVGYNGQEITSLPLKRVAERLRHSRRPLVLSFIPGSLKPTEESSTARNNSNNNSTGKGVKAKDTQSAATGEADSGSASSESASKLRKTTVQFKEDKLLLVIKRQPKGPDRSAWVDGFKKRDDGNPGPAEESSVVKRGDVLCSINGKSTLSSTFKETFRAFAQAERPIQLTFCENPEFEVDMPDSCPSDLKIEVFDANEAMGVSPEAGNRNRNRDGDGGGDGDGDGQNPERFPVITGFKHIPGPAEAQCGHKLQKGFKVVEVNSKNVSEFQFNQVIDVLKNEPRPLTVKFAPGDHFDEEEESELVSTTGDSAAVADRVDSDTEGDKKSGLKPGPCSATFSDGPLGLIFHRGHDHSCRLKAFSQFPGPAKKTELLYPGLVLLEVNDMPVVTEDRVSHEAIEEWLSSLKPPCKLRVRDMEKYKALWGTTGS